MKRQGFRFKLLAVLLIMLIALAAAYGVQILPATEKRTSLRDAVVRLTRPERRQTDSAFPDTQDPALSAVPSSASEQHIEVSLSPGINTDETLWTPIPPISEALSNYFSSDPSVPKDTSRETDVYILPVP